MALKDGRMRNESLLNMGKLTMSQEPRAGKILDNIQSYCIINRFLLWLIKNAYKIQSEGNEGANKQTNTHIKKNNIKFK